MSRIARPKTLLALIGALLAGALASSPAASGRARTSVRPLNVRALLKSRELWATIDVCSPADKPNEVGIRGSMPGDGRPHDRMYMSFRLQYLDAPTGRWLNLASGSTPSFVAVGAAAAVRQDGWSFRLVPAAGKPAVTLRGVVDYQWRRGRTVLASAVRLTTAGHRSVAGADPPTYSAATCLIG